ncbi:MAG TPA: NAD(P) transhydrogenase subunit alpha [Rectinemataceae bacterium]|nr:NAD(P) transhydrogenase subunit alpha [Rectinemataceae bacterium]
MAVLIGIPRERKAGERRVALVPDLAKKYTALGAGLLVEAGAGEGSSLHDADFGGAEIAADSKSLFGKADLILKVTPPSLEEIASMKRGSVLVGYLQPWQEPERIKALMEAGVESYAVELIPRISRAQSMDALSSQGAVAGYQCVLIAAGLCPKFFPMLTYAAGTIRPARVLVIGTGVAGLQAIATAKRLGAIVEAYDVRPETKEQVESLGAKFVDTGVSAAGTGGYARELTEDEKRQQAERLGKVVAACDVLITTAAVPGRRAPLIITETMVAGMKNGAVVVDMAAEGGGNVAGSKAGAIVQVGGATIVGPLDLPSRMPVHASEMYAKNLYNFISPFIKEGRLELDRADEIIAGSCLTRGGELVHEAVRKAHGGKV